MEYSERVGRFPFGHMAYGGDYNPEQWPESVWEEDVRLMREAGVNLVSLGIFSWAKLEPQPGQYDFGWLDRIIDLLHTNGVSLSLATATASPPPWLSRLHPESLPVTVDGVTLWPGSRQHYCPNSTAYREAAQALVRQIARRYGDHPALALWHVGNEYSCHEGGGCYCDESARAFRVWLRRKYETLDALNAAWGTAFWSQQYGAWDEINPPRRAPTFRNPTQQLDWARFSSDALLECFELERAILREVTPDVPITTNFMRLFKPLDYWKWAAREDFVTLDQYQDPADPLTHIDAALNFDLVRSLGYGKPWLLMEQTTYRVNWRQQNLPKQPGQMRLWSHQAIARGSNGVMFFQWRASKAGAEKFHSAMVPHVGTDSQIWREVVALGQELRRLDAVLPTEVSADVAMIFDWETWWALELDAKPTADLRFTDQVRAFYEPLFQRNVTVDFVPPDADLSGYRLVVVPNLYLVRDEAAAQLERYVRDGGTLVMSFFSGIVDENEHIRLGGYPAPFRAMLGLRVEDFVPYAPEQTNEILAEDGTRYSCDLWADLIDLEGATALAHYTGGFYAERPALTRHSFGQGTAYYIGTRPTADALDWLLKRACENAGVAPAYTVPAGVEVIRRQRENASLLYLLNHRDEPVEIALAETATDLLTGRSISGHLRLEPLDVAILRTKNLEPRT
ncbi:MAG TPA: beta-galactosidase [Herpetosiphonaceae bacterium]